MQPERLTDIFKALSNPHRLQIFMGLFDCSAGCEQTVGEIAALFSLAPSTVSHHLKELRQAGLVTCQRDGQRVVCRMNPEVVANLQDFISQLRPPTT